MAAIAVEAASSMETAASMKTASAVKAAATMESTAIAPAETASAFKSASAVVSAAVVPTPVAAAAIVTAVVASAVISIRTPVEAMEPWASADKDAIRKPIRPIVAIRRAGVGVIAIIAVSTNRSRADVRRSDSHTDHHALRVRIRACEQANAQ